MKERIVQFLFVSLFTIQVYYLYRFIYSIPLRYTEPVNIEKTDIDMVTLSRGVGNSQFIGNFRGMHKQTRQPLLRLEQTKSDNNTALIYTPLTNSDVVVRF